MYKVYLDISATIMNEIFTLSDQNQHNLRNRTDFDVPKVITVNHGCERGRYLISVVRFGKLNQHK